MPVRLVKTKHFNLTSTVKKMISKIPPGKNVPTIKELQETYSISRGTVDRILDRLQSEHLIHRPGGKQRYVVSNHHDHASRRIAIIRPDYPSPSYEVMARTIVQIGKKCNWIFDLVYYRSLTTLDLRRSIGNNDAGILFPTSEEFPDHILQFLTHADNPVIVAQEPLDIDVNEVYMDDFGIGKMAAEHLLSLGHRKILCVLDQPLSGVIRERLLGWRKAMEVAGVKNMDELIVDCSIHPGEEPMQKTYEYFNEWMNNPHPDFTAIFNTSDFGGMSVMRALREHSIQIPQDVSVIAHGGESNFGPFLYPALTTVETDVFSFGQAVVKNLGGYLNNPDIKPVKVKIEPSLVVRQTTMALSEK